MSFSSSESEDDKAPSRTRLSRRKLEEELFGSGKEDEEVEETKKEMVDVVEINKNLCRIQTEIEDLSNKIYYSDPMPELLEMDELMIRQENLRREEVKNREQLEKLSTPYRVNMEPGKKRRKVIRWEPKVSEKDLSSPEYFSHTPDLPSPPEKPIERIEKFISRTGPKTPSPSRRPSAAPTYKLNRENFLARTSSHGPAEEDPALGGEVQRPEEIQSQGENTFLSSNNLNRIIPLSGGKYSKKTKAIPKLMDLTFTAEIVERGQRIMRRWAEEEKEEMRKWAEYEKKER